MSIRIKTIKSITMLCIISLTAVLAACSDDRDVDIGEDHAAADTVLRNGYIYTVDKDNSVAQALAVSDGTIVYVGNNSDVDDFIGPDTKVIDLQGRMVMPGLQDAHIHGITVANPQCDLNYKPLTIKQFKARINKCLQNPEFGKGPDDWLVVNHWYIQFLTPPGTSVTKEVLDSLDTQRPIIVNGVWGHSALANSRALELAGIDADTPNPSDGVIERNDAGQPNGFVDDGAQRLVRNKIPSPPPADPVKAAHRGMEVLVKAGLTSFQAQSKNKDTVAAFAKLRAEHKLPARAHFLIGSGEKTGQELTTLIDHLDSLRSKFERPQQIPLQVRAWRPNHEDGPRLVPEPGVSIDGVGEVMADGLFQYPTQTAALLQPYLVNKGTKDNPQWVPGDDRGELYIDDKALGTMATKLARNGYQIQIHTIGDRAVRTSLDAFQALRANIPLKGNPDDSDSGGYGHENDSRPLQAHDELVDPNDQGRFKQLGVVPVMSYQWAKPGPDSTDAVKPYIGPTRWKRYEPEGDLERAGAKIAYGSDYPVDPLNYWFAIEVAVTRQADWGPDFPKYAGTLNAAQALSLQQAIRGITINSAYAMHQDNVTGSLEKGKLADLLVLNQNLFDIPRDDISETQVLMTMVGGKEVYMADDFNP